MTLTKSQLELLEKLNANFENGMTTDEASERREESGGYNTIEPPIKCPAWVCCLLPCIKNIPSMKLFKQIQPEDAEIKRNGSWVRYDASSVVQGDIVRLEEGDIVPCDCIVLVVEGHDLLVDCMGVLGEEKPRVIASEALQDDVSSTNSKLYYGCHVIQGSCIAVATAIGNDTLLATLIREKKFPPSEGGVVIEEEDHDAEQGISLISRSTAATVA